MTVSGTDVSHWNEHPILDDYAFIIHKCTEGEKSIDSRYAERQQWAYDHGKMWGAYHFYKPMMGVEKQLAHFMRHANIGEGDIVALDFEDDDTWGRYQRRAIANEGHLFIGLLMAEYPNNRVLLYGNRSCYTGYMLPFSMNQGDGLWIASPGLTPTGPWVIWQYGNGSLDYDRAIFNTADDMRHWLTTKGVPSNVHTVMELDESYTWFHPRRGAPSTNTFLLLAE